MVRVIGKLRNRSLLGWIKELREKHAKERVLVLVSCVSMRQLRHLKDQYDLVFNGQEWLSGKEFYARIGK